MTPSLSAVAWSVRRCMLKASAAKGAYHAFGFSGHGFALGPIVERIITDLVVKGNADLPIEAFDIGRFSNSVAA